MLNRLRFRQLKDRSAGLAMAVVAGLAAALVMLIVVGLLTRSWPLLGSRPLGELLTSSRWSPQRGEFGFLPFILGTLWVTTLAMVLAVPPCLLSAIYLSEYAPRRLREAIKPLLDLLAGIPSVVYGLWGVLVCVPLIRNTIAPWASQRLSFIPMLAVDNPTGYSTLAGGIVLAVMVFPVIISVTQEVIRAVPDGLREASLALGATKFETTWRVVLPSLMPSILTGLILAMARAAGEVAPLMLTGVVKLAPSLPVDGTPPYLHLERKFMHLGFHIYDVGFQSPNVDAARPMVFATAFLLLALVVALNLTAIVLRRRLRRKYFSVTGL